MLGQSEPPKGKALQELGRRTVVLPLGLWGAKLSLRLRPLQRACLLGAEKKNHALSLRFLFFGFFSNK